MTTKQILVLLANQPKGKVEKSSSSSSSGGIGFCGLLTIVFITLKLTKVIDWSWWWVLSPIWGSIVVAIVIFLVVFAFLLIFDRK